MSNLNSPLFNLRKQHKFTQDEIAEKLGVSRLTYARYENGERKMTSATIKKLADIYDVSSDYLLNIEDTTSGDVEIMELREELRRDPGKQMLFSLAKDATSKDIMIAVNVLKALKEQNE